MSKCLTNEEIVNLIVDNLLEKKEDDDDTDRAPELDAGPFSDENQELPT